MNSNSERILIIQTAFLGDAVLTLPMIQKLKIENPQFIIDVLAIPSTEQLFVSSPYVQNVIVIDKRKKHKGIFALNKFISELKLNNYKRVYSPHRSFRSAYITLRLEVNETYGFNNSSLRYAYKKVIPYNYSDHEVQRNLALITTGTDETDWNIYPEIQAAEKYINRVNELLRDYRLAKSFVLIAPGSVWMTKRYPPKSYADVIRLLIKQDEEIILIGGADDVSLCNDIKSGFAEKVFNFAGQLAVPETVYLMTKSKLLITNDSAPTHLAMCADIPVLTIYCSTVPGFGFYPYNNKSAVLSYDALNCKPCGIHGFNNCPVKSFDCGNKLSPEEVVIEARKLLDDHG